MGYISPNLSVKDMKKTLDFCAAILKTLPNSP
jgi:hypothetical protein